MRSGDTIGERFRIERLIGAGGMGKSVAEQALGGNDLEATIALVERALVCGPKNDDRGELLRIRADAHNWRGESGDAERWALAAVNLLPAGTTRWYAAVGAAAWAAGALGHADRLVEVAGKLETSWSEPAVSSLQMAAPIWTRLLAIEPRLAIDFGGD